MSLVDSQSPVLLEKVVELIKKKVPASQAHLVADFAKRLYRNIASDDLTNRHDSDMYGAVLGLWHSFNEYITLKSRRTAGSLLIPLLKLFKMICHLWSTQCAWRWLVWALHRIYYCICR
jgi:hypothetical protein